MMNIFKTLVGAGRTGLMLLPLVAFATGASAASSTTADHDLKLWYPAPAKQWVEALPIGGGRLGAMIFGGVEEERIQFNEDTVWNGKPHEYHHEGAVKFLPQLRQLLWEGKQREAEDLATREFMSVPLRQKAYQAFGDIHISFPSHANPSDYRRELDLDTAVARVSYKIGDATFQRETFASYPDQAIVCRISANKRGQVNFTARLSSLHKSATTLVRENNQLALTGTVEEGGIRFEARLRINARGGKVSVSESGITVENADEATLVLVGATNYRNYRDVSADPSVRCADALKAIGRRDFTALLRRHIADYQPLFRRVSIDLGVTKAAEQPTDVRIRSLDKDADPQLAELYYQFGRYLLIASSRPGSQPANLQGIWNDSLTPPWDSKYTVNINTEMNYWPAEPCNLSEMAEPLFAMLEDCAVTGRKTAQAHYGARGWVLHHNTDLWRGTAPINRSNHGIWVTGGAWLCQHFWERYLFTGDKDFLRKRAYPIMKEASIFFTDFLVRDPKTGKLISGPSNSPENGGLVMGPTMDHQIIRELFANTIKAAEILGVDKDFAAKLAEMRREIAPNKIGKHGQLQEWLEDIDDPKNTHRHVSHLWGLHPGSEINPATPELFAAAKQTLVHRGDGGTGWSLAWKINFWARLLDGDHAYKMLCNQLSAPGAQNRAVDSAGGGTYPNMFDAHPPFQIDGNFGGTAGITEMILQTQLTESRGEKEFRVIDLLPALPKAWPNGSVSGLRARGGFELAFSWKDGKIASVTIESKLGTPAIVRSGGKTVELTARKGKYRLNHELALTR